MVSVFHVVIEEWHTIYCRSVVIGEDFGEMQTVKKQKNVKRIAMHKSVKM